MSNARIHEFDLRVRYAETDRMGVVYYGNYLMYFEVARAEFMRHVGIPYSEMERRGIVMAVSEVYCRYRQPAFFDDVLLIRTWVSEMSRVRVKFEHEIYRKETMELLATGYARLGCVSPAGRIQRLPEDIANALESKLIVEAGEREQFGG